MDHKQFKVASANWHHVYGIGGEDYTTYGTRGMEKDMQSNGLDPL